MTKTITWLGVALLASCGDDAGDQCYEAGYSDCESCNQPDAVGNGCSTSDLSTAYEGGYATCMQEYANAECYGYDTGG